MKIYTIHSPSHQHYFDMFESSFYENTAGKHTLHSRKVPQISNPDFDSKDVHKFYRLMALYILELLYTETEPFIFMGVDIYFFRDFNIDMGDNDMVITYEKHILGLPTVCTGVICLKPNKRNRRMYLWILKHFDRLKHDQNGVNAYLYTHPFSIKWELLPKEFYAINYDNGDKVWDGEDVDVTIKNPYLFHYHWTIGDSNRIKLLEMVKRKIK